MRGASRLRIVLFSIGVALAAVSAPACKKDGGGGAAAKDEASRSLERFKAEITRLQQAAAKLRAQVGALPEDLPGLEEYRHKLFTLDEVLGVENGRSQWLAGELATAAASGKKEEIQKVSTLINGAIAGCSAIEKRIVELTHELIPFERLAGPYRAMDAAGLVFKHPLSTGYEIKARKDGVEQQLVAFLDDGKRKVDKKTWFTFDNVTFTGDGALLDLVSSQWQLDNLAAILKAYPQVKLEIGGYTDNTGPAAASKQLSAERADAVKQRLVAAGVAADRLTAEGYGPARPVCPANNTDECKARNRRIALRVTAK